MTEENRTDQSDADSKDAYENNAFLFVLEDGHSLEIVAGDNDIEESIE